MLLSPYLSILRLYQKISNGKERETLDGHTYDISDDYPTKYS